MSSIHLPYPHTGQQRVRQEARRFNWLSAGRRWRKTTLCMSIVVEAASTGGQYIWGAPTYDQVRVGWAETRRATRGVVAFNQSRMEATFPSGGVIYYRSLDNPDNARGRTADGVVLDEAADLIPDAWHEVLRPMLLDTHGWAWAVGTPKGRNWYYVEHQRARERDDSACWNTPTLGVRVGTAGRLERAPHPLENPYIDLREMQQLYETMPETSFRQEILGEFVESGAGVFRKVIEACQLQQHDPEYGHQYVIGVDWGRSHDYTVFSVLDSTSRHQVALERSNQVEYHHQHQRLLGLAGTYKPIAIVAEANAMGEPIIEQLQRSGLPVRPFTTTNASKAAIIDNLALAFEQGTVQLLDDPTQRAELQAYTSERLPSGLIRYGAPSGQHDDCVMALALALHGASATELQPMDSATVEALTGFTGL